MWRVFYTSDLSTLGSEPTTFRPRGRFSNHQAAAAADYCSVLLSVGGTTPFQRATNIPRRQSRSKRRCLLTLMFDATEPNVTRAEQSKRVRFPKASLLTTGPTYIIRTTLLGNAALMLRKNDFCYRLSLIGNIWMFRLTSDSSADHQCSYIKISSYSNPSPDHY